MNKKEIKILFNQAGETVNTAFSVLEAHGIEVRIRLIENGSSVLLDRRIILAKRDYMLLDSHPTDQGAYSGSMELHLYGSNVYYELIYPRETHAGGA